MENQTDRMLIGRPGEAQKNHWKERVVKGRFVDCMTNGGPVNRFSQLSFESLQLLQGNHCLLVASLINALSALQLGG
ncbi:hypothetical protein AMECASPLE_021049 [Ameca splendens]|uniref:Uncharacterized protein n=1 Tax=Ameca splendens TaxID=208324 RepID=A0ABV0Y3Y1_9TELE